MMMIEGTGLPCRVVRLAGGVRSPPGVGANEPSWATLCARCGSEQGGGASVHVVVVLCALAECAHCGENVHSAETAPSLFWRPCRL